MCSSDLATAPVITDILLANDFTSPNNLSNRDRFVTLSDYVTEQLSTASNLSDTGVIRKGLNLETMFNAGSAGTIGDITSGSVYEVIVTGKQLLGYACLFPGKSSDGAAMISILWELSSVVLIIQSLMG